MNGFERELKNRILSVVPHGQIYSVEQPFVQWQSALPRIENTQGVVGCSYILLTGLLEKGTELKADKLWAFHLKSRVISACYLDMSKTMHGKILRLVSNKLLLVKVLLMHQNQTG